MVNLKTPIEKAVVRQLSVGDTVYIDGKVITARDEAHMRALEYFKEGKPLPEDWNGAAIFHCGPVMRKLGDRWEVVAAGPTTSSRMNSLEPETLEKYGVSAIIGKGGMNKQVSEALKKYGGVYLAMVGGCGATAAKAIKEVTAVHWLDLGIPEAMWVFRVENFGPFTVAMDAKGNSLYEKVDEVVDRNLQRLIERLK